MELSAVGVGVGRSVKLAGGSGEGTPPVGEGGMAKGELVGRAVTCDVGDKVCGCAVGAMDGVEVVGTLEGAEVGGLVVGKGVGSVVGMGTGGDVTTVSSEQDPGTFVTCPMVGEHVVVST